ncbi:MAG: hybrid sensor histidine kinase/response regulator [Candidatus Ozemobacteraceae bacterium]
MEKVASKNVVLVVDDVLENIEILGRILSAEYRVRVARNGMEGLKIAESPEPPDLILLDIMMPEVDGYDVCRRLKASSATKDIPIVFLTALSDDDDESKGLSLGAVDFITKPFNPELVRMRVHNHLALRLAQKELQRHSQHLEELVCERTRELAKAHERLKLLDDAKREFLYAISHELRTPANGVLGIGELALNAIPSSRERDELSEYFSRSSRRLMETIENALHLAQLQNADACLRLVAVNLDSVLRFAVNRIQTIASKARVDLFLPESGNILVFGDESLLQQAMTTFLHTAVKFSVADNKVVVSLHAENDMQELRFVSHGRALPEAAMENFFDTFSTARTSSVAEELGLAIPLASCIIMAMGGTVRMEKDESGGICLTCVIPLAKQ